MRRIYAVWILRKLTSPTAMKLIMLFAVLKESFSVVSVSNVLANSPSLWNFFASYRFFMSAFWNTETVVRLLFIACLALFAWVIRDFARKTALPQLRTGS